MKKHMNKSLTAVGLSFAMLATSIAPSVTAIAAETDSSTTGTGDLGTNLALTATAAAAYTNTYGISTKKINDGTLATPDAQTSWNCWGAAEEKYPDKKVQHRPAM